MATERDLGDGTKLMFHNGNLEALREFINTDTLKQHQRDFLRDIANYIQTLEETYLDAEADHLKVLDKIEQMWKNMPNAEVICAGFHARDKGGDMATIFQAMAKAHFK